MNKFVLAVVGLAFCCAAVTADDPAWSDLRGSFLILKDESFAQFPRTRTDADSNGWTPVSSTANDCTNGGLFNGVQYIKTNDYSVGLLYDKNGIIAGLQMLIPHNTVLGPNNTVRYGDIPMYVNTTFNGNKYFALTTYLQQPSTICTRGRTQTELEQDGTGTGVWIQNGTSPSASVQIPLSRPDATARGWTENNCFPAMGYHNFYMMEQYAQSNCDLMQPIFGLYNADDELHGFGLITPGNIDNPRFEHPPDTAIKMILGDKYPQCVIDLQQRIGVTSLHVYFIPRPYLWTCSVTRAIGNYLSSARNWLSNLG
ncbi:hypothetical protein Ocin01_01553 [Orchesella cincta]|uniref:Uncharacterized protein n=1 Tax=Orchesella cincta TaxID=48709 RepID=A0A1D2NIT9_ORCCI|nr:hypothetical protein Ocin01_01553 [Orchesella cincta]